MTVQLSKSGPLERAAHWLSDQARRGTLPARKLPDWAWRIRHRGWLAARGQQQLFYALARSRGFAENQLVSRETELVIEGFPRSANSYAVIGFHLAQPGWRAVAHHTHAPAQVVRAAERSVPLLVPIRHPGDAVASLLIRDPRYSVGLALAAYISFYETIVPYLDYMVLARFEDITHDLGSVINRVNERFGTTFSVPGSDDESKAACFRLIEQIDAQHGGSERTVARPSAWRQEQKREVLARVLASHRYESALAVYHRALLRRAAPALGRTRVIVLSASS